MCAAASKPASPQPPMASAGALRTLIALGGTPAAWTLQTLVSYAMSAHACYPEHEPLHAPLWDGLLMKLEWAVMLICLGLGIAAAVVAWRWWRQVRRADEQRRRPARTAERTGSARSAGTGQAEQDTEAQTRARAGARTQDAPPGRVRFLAMSGVMVSCVFLVALLFTASATLMMPPCGPWRT